MVKGKKGKKHKGKSDQAAPQAPGGGFALPDGLRHAGEMLKKASENPVVSELAVAALLAAAAALKESPKVRAAAASAGDGLAEGAEATTNGASKAGVVLKAAAVEAMRQFAASYTDAGSTRPKRQD